MVGAIDPATDPGKMPQNHSSEFRLDEGALKLGVRALLQVSLDTLGANKTEVE